MCSVHYFTILDLSHIIYIQHDSCQFIIITFAQLSRFVREVSVCTGSFSFGIRTSLPSIHSTFQLNDNGVVGIKATSLAVSAYSWNGTLITKSWVCSNVIGEDELVISLLKGVVHGFSIMCIWMIMDHSNGLKTSPLLRQMMKLLFSHQKKKNKWQWHGFILWINLHICVLKIKWVGF